MKRFVKRLLRFVNTTIVKCEAKSVGKNMRVNKYSKVTKNTVLGDNVNFNGLRIDGDANVTIGNNFHCAKNCIIITDIHDYDHGDSIPYDSKRKIKKDVIIEDNVWIGYGVIILGGVEIGEGSIIQAGSVVVKSIPPFSIAGGHPAKKFKERDIEHYMKLKKEGAFS